MTTSPTISKAPPALPDMDFAQLREQGIGHIERLSGEVWTDYNTHDPGITLLEVLCYAITDLGYRMDQPIEDLLAAETGNEAAMRRQFQTPAQALSCEPVTEKDYRKLFMDIPEVMNAWLTKHEGVRYFVHCKTGKVSPSPPVDPKEQRISFIVNGLYDVHLQLDPSTYDGAITDNQRRQRENAVFKKVRQVYQAHRNLGEDLVNVGTVNYQPFSICADIRLAAAADIEAVHARILYDVQRFLTPPVNRYSLQELLDRGKSTEEIFDGQVPRFGFFDEDELDKSTLPDAERILRSSDLIGLIMQVPGVVAIPKFHLKLTDDDSEVGALWSLPIEMGKFPLLSPRSPMRFYKDIFRYNSHADEVAERLRALENEDLQRRRNLEGAAHDLPIPLGVWRDLGSFHTVQHDLPPLYGVGPMGVSAAGSDAEVIARRAKAKQLQAYLLFFDQILSNHAALLEALPGLLSPSPAGVSEERVRRTYFARLTEGVNEVKSLFKLLSDAADDVELQEKMGLLGERLNSLLFSKTLTNEVLDQRRRNRQLDHLLARYAENFDDYVLMMHQVFGGRRQEWEIIDDKDDFLNEHPLLSRHRAMAYTGTATGIDAEGNEVPLKLWYDASNAGLPNESVNVAGVVRRVARLTGIDNYKPRNLAKIAYEVYQEKDQDDISEFRFRVVDVGGKKILLSGSTRYLTEEACILEMQAAVNRGLFPDGYERKTTVNGKFYFNLVDANGEVLARRIEYFDTEEQREDAIQYLIDFLTERYSPEGFFLVEHLLLRPLTKQDDFLPVCTDEGCQTCESPDPYSFRVSVVLPGYAPRFSNMVFRSYFERTLRAELSAHILAKICWIGEGQMAEFEVRYRAWLEYRQTVLSSGKPDKDNQALNDLLEILQNLHTIYPPGTLHDCEEDREDRPIVLGRSHLGTQREEDLNPDD